MLVKVEIQRKPRGSMATAPLVVIGDTTTASAQVELNVGALGFPLSFGTISTPLSLPP